MNVQLTYYLPEDQSEYILAVNAPGMFSALWDFSQWLRSEIKYNDKDYGAVRDKFYEILGDANVNLDDMA